jgi:hypothetical protein
VIREWFLVNNVGKISNIVSGINMTKEQAEQHLLPLEDEHVTEFVSQALLREYDGRNSR